MVEQVTPFSAEQKAEIERLLANRYPRTKAAQEAERDLYLMPPPPPSVDRRLVRTGEFQFAGVIALALAGLELAEKPEFQATMGDLVLTDGSFDVGKVCMTLIAAVVFVARQYAKAKTANGGANNA